MLHDCNQKTINVIKIGNLDTTTAYRVLLMANQVQKAFHFEYIPEIELTLEQKYKLPNGGFNISAALKKQLKLSRYKNIPRPIIALTSDPLGEIEHANDKDWFFFSSQEDDWDKSVTIISTQPLSALPKHRTLENYLFMMFSTYIFSYYADMAFHNETRECFLDYCDELSDAEKSLQAGKLCFECEQVLQKRLRTNKISIEQVSAAIRLMNQAVNRKYCFTVMPFNKMFDKVYNAIKEVAKESGWMIKRADEITFPRLITNKIVKEIMTSDLVIADLTGFNPNVFYEVGLAHTIGNDLVLLTQGKEIPFDLKNEQTIFYSKDHLSELKKQLVKSIK